jgi:FkbM family methyltransferase
MKSALKRTLRRAAARAPWGARFALLDGCLDGMTPSDVAATVLPRLGISEVAADGDRGTMLSAAADTMVILEYGAAGTFAPQVTEAIRAFFAPAGGTFVDIGANIGLMTVPFAQAPRIRCLAFEPDPTNFRFLERNLARNAPAHSAELHQLALFTERATLSPALAEGNLGDHRLTFAGGRRTSRPGRIAGDGVLPLSPAPTRRRSRSADRTTGRIIAPASDWSRLSYTTQVDMIETCGTDEK